MFGIEGYETFKVIAPIDKGWSSDKKYYIETVTNEKRLLRTAAISEYDSKKVEFTAMKLLAEKGLPISKPVDFGTCEEGSVVYTLFTWCDGEDAERVLPQLSEAMQYELGVESGKVLREIHRIPAPAGQEDWETRFNLKIDHKIKQYKECGIKIEGDDQVFAYIQENRHLLAGRPQCFQHGDYHVGNMVISPEEKLSILDFNRYDYGDPWEEFNRIVFSAKISPHFATGQLNGYFDGRPPIPFFQLLALYISTNMLSSIPWAMSFGEEELTVMKNQAKDVLDWFDGMNNPIPNWYLEDFFIQCINDIPYKLKAPFDFSFIEKYGDVFQIYDDQDSGNICFGVQKDGMKYFIKFAGAPTERYTGQPEDAIARLKSTIPIYRDLTHPNLVRLIKAEEVGEGFAAIFEWTDSQCMGKMYPLSRKKFLEMSDSTRMEVFNDVLAFHLHVVKQGYVAIDYYDGSILYDFDLKKTLICDIDLYSKTPYINTMGRMWGSSRFMAPEEFTLGAAIDEITNVYLMGATAFALFGGETDRSIEKWRLSRDLYEVASKAVHDNKDKRQQTLLEFEREWNGAKFT